MSIIASLARLRTSSDVSPSFRAPPGLGLYPSSAIPVQIGNSRFGWREGRNPEIGLHLPGHDRDSVSRPRASAFWHIAIPVLKMIGGWRKGDAQRRSSWD